ncbi:MAG: hypothetical protein GEV28_34535 [Actinophytocola sp.]|uniref:hypothetical protein n=1 Tax=Actinophytocola sp. TaxID=1872138 RepID=UPI001326B910|nr:hypothetical protein [Actinophytocola sp.]MPZ85233.1 hypothetical protein [Actinophytocola sp.]
MVRLGLDDTLHAIVQVTHEHGLPLHGASVNPGFVHAFTDAVDLPWWVRWLTDPAAEESRGVVWQKDAEDTGAEVVFHVSGQREGIEWTVTDHVPVVVAGSVLDAYGVTVTGEHRAVPVAAAVAVADAHAKHATGQASTAGGDRS